MQTKQMSFGRALLSTNESPKKGDVLAQSPWPLNTVAYETRQTHEPLDEYYTRDQMHTLAVQALLEAQRGLKIERTFGVGAYSIRQVRERLPSWFLSHWDAFNWFNEALCGRPEDLSRLVDAFEADFFGALAILMKCHEEYYGILIVEPSFKANCLTYVHNPNPEHDSDY